MSLAFLASGVGLAAMSLRHPDRAATFERWSGLCLVCGLCLLGVALPAIR